MVAIELPLAEQQEKVFTDAQAAIQRITSEEPGPGQKYAIQARKWITTLRRMKPEVVVEIRWCPAHQGVASNEKADEWAKVAAEEPDTHGVEWLGYGDRYGRPRSLANIKREISEKK
jgi:ribonuclease HI